MILGQSVFYGMPVGEQFKVCPAIVVDFNEGGTVELIVFTKYGAIAKNLVTVKEEPTLGCAFPVAE